MEKGVEGTQVCTLSSGRVPRMLPAAWPAVPHPQSHHALPGRPSPYCALGSVFLPRFQSRQFFRLGTLGFDTSLSSAMLSMCCNVPVLSGPLGSGSRGYEPELRAGPGQSEGSLQLPSEQPRKSFERGGLWWGRVTLNMTALPKLTTCKHLLHT